MLWTLYQSLGGDSATGYHVYYFLVGFASMTGQLSTVYTDMASTRNMFKQCQPPLSTEQYQWLHSLLHGVLMASGRSEEAGQVMVELLGASTM